MLGRKQKLTLGSEKLSAILVPHTHWDREWYSPFQVFRTRLVKMIDSLLFILANDPKFTCFVMDGQTIPIEDYLEVRPEREQEMKKYIREGRIIIGPSYILPDNFLVSGEAHIRNLLLGMRLGEDYGRVSRVGYMPDAFGQIAQMPQIFQGFGIDTAIFTRGVGDEGENLKSEFLWSAPDGMSSVLTHWLVLHYANLKDVSTNMSSALAYTLRTVNMLRKKATTQNVLLMNGNDHVEPQPHIPHVVEYLNKSNVGIDVKIGAFADYFQLVKAEKPSLQTYEGEFRGSKYEAVLTGVTSARTYLKQANIETETLLEQWVEPFDAWAWSLGEKHNHGLVWQAWKYTLQCHPHDSICGCGADSVHGEMMKRFRSAQQLGGSLLGNSLCAIASKINLEKNDYAIVVFNPLSWARTDVVETTIFKKKSTDEFKLIDPDGKSVVFNVLGSRTIGRVYSAKIHEEVLDIAFLAEHVPPCGYKTYRVRTLIKEEPEKEVQTVSKGPRNEGNAIENEYFKVKAEEDGSVILIDRTTGTTYSGFNTLEDGGDVGDEYNYDPPREERLFSNKGLKAEVTQLENGPTRFTLRVEYELILPVNATEDRKARSSNFAPCRVTCCISLAPKVPRVDFTLEFDNAVKDHRLRVVFPTRIISDHAYADQAFHVIKRPIAMPQGKNWLEHPAPTHAMQSFVSLSDGEKGITVATRGLMEYEVRQDGTIAITLIRSVGMLSQEELSTRPAAGPLIPTPDAQCQGKRFFNYSVAAHKGTWEDSKAYLQAMQHKVPLRTVQVVDHEFAVLREQAIIPGQFKEPIVKVNVSQNSPLPLKLSFLSVQPDNIIVSAIKRAEDGKGIIVRVYNTTREKVTGTLTLAARTGEIVQVDMREERADESQIEENEIHANGQELSFEARPFRVLTFRLTAPAALQIAK